jgi:hypothetical protein
MLTMVTIVVVRILTNADHIISYVCIMRSNISSFINGLYSQISENQYTLAIVRGIAPRKQMISETTPNTMAQAPLSVMVLSTIVPVKM